MNKKQRGILYGMSFGDGGIYLLKDQSKETARMTIGHSPKQREYLEYKNQLLLSIFGGKLTNINEYTSLNKKMNKEYTNLQLCRTEKYFRQMHRVLYATGQKIYTGQVLDYITDHGLALWYMDDGSGVVCRNNKGSICGCMTRIATYCSKDEAELIKDWFKSKYNLDCKFDIDKRNNKYSIRFNTQDSRKFVDIVYPYIIPIMMYKVEHVEKYNPRVPSPSFEGDDIV